MRISFEIFWSSSIFLQIPILFRSTEIGNDTSRLRGLSPILEITKQCHDCDSNQWRKSCKSNVLTTTPRSDRCCRILSVGGDGMFTEVVHGLLTNVLKASGSDQPSVDTILPQPKWRIGIIPAGMSIFHIMFVIRYVFCLWTKKYLLHF